MASNMQLILARDVPHLGRVGELVSVRPGYARNYLIPKGLGLLASTKRVAQFEHQKKVIDHRRRILRTESEARAQDIAELQITLTAKVGGQGKLFGSVTNRDIARDLAAQGYVIDPRDLKLDAPLKTTGLHVLDLRLEADVTTQVKVVIVAEKVEEDEAQQEAEEPIEQSADSVEENEPDLDAEESAIVNAEDADTPAEAAE
jgi:large subunit ribosomal protein L9